MGINDSSVKIKQEYISSKGKLSMKKVMPNIVVFVFFVILAILALFPFYYLLIGSFKPATELFRKGLDMKIDLNIMSFKNYAILFSEEGSLYRQWYKNSLLMTLVGTVVTLLLSSMVGYGLAKYQFKGKNLVFMLVLLIIFVPFEILMLPLYRLILSFRLINTYWGVILPGIVSPIAVFFFRQYADGLPKELMDAARIDGATEFGIYWRIMVPLMKPAFGAMAIFVALGNWNNFVWPLIVMRTEDMFTLPVGLMTLLTPYGSNYQILLAGSALAIVPIIILFLINQNAFISGLTGGSIKE
ncbi:binding-protein-dependent transport systems inner membrane component [Thermoanaerobacter mathranii subsp. mathranii str. A3]|uniref:Binding-protein-dependent transport systems inner membrane component n=2 Tax=Thermoanaerobacter mathranii TaxID=583357 RepID=A0ABM5LRJ2_THEM3|nr:carbohydrate ABC transporter permease [Thermoanaerobacter mathranii]ADH61397.1 binding-protein-dependent transport systems inner membrane component [Thermoanaerobacter mathranii subsp. mathranii str. A3]